MGESQSGLGILMLMGPGVGMGMERLECRKRRPGQKEGKV